jgi:hypothetical protein
MMATPDVAARAATELPNPPANDEVAAIAGTLS